MNKIPVVLSAIGFSLGLVALFHCGAPEIIRPTSSTLAVELSKSLAREDSVRRWYEDALKTDSASTGFYVEWLLKASQDSMQLEMDRRVALARRTVEDRFGKDSNFQTALVAADRDTSCWTRLTCGEAGVLFAAEESARMDRDSLQGLLKVREAKCTTIVAELRVAQDSAVAVAESKGQSGSMWRMILGLVFGFLGIGFGAGIAL